MRVRPEQPADVDAVRELNRAAFEGPDEARIVDALRGAVAPLVSLVPEDDVPDEVFMAVELVAGGLAGRTRTVRYHQAFAG